MPPLAGLFFLVGPMAGLAAVVHLKKPRKAPPPEAKLSPLMAPIADTHDEDGLPKASAMSESWRASIGQTIQEEDHSALLAEHYRKAGPQGGAQGPRH
ncbi:hypothetical protein [Phenylobacterium sp.]|uniref:hypothetical protein n=1 Tax=Phenylobacterium sp. TaxID=1871053 RepID=UPI0035AFE100